MAAHNPSEYRYDGGWANIFDTEKLKIVMYFNRGTWADSDDYY